jgi:hypothetical protein
MINDNPETFSPFDIDSIDIDTNEETGAISITLKCNLTKKIYDEIIHLQAEVLKANNRVGSDLVPTDLLFTANCYIGKKVYDMRTLFVNSNKFYNLSILLLEICNTNNQSYNICFSEKKKYVDYALLGGNKQELSFSIAETDKGTSEQINSIKSFLESYK